MQHDRVVIGHVVTPKGVLADGWVAIDGDRIAAIGTGPAPAADAVDDHTGCTILPGMIDGQTHATNHAGMAGFTPASRAALAGGITTIVDMPYDEPEPLTTRAHLDAKAAAVARYAHCDVALYGTAAPGQDVADVLALIDAGACAIKLSSFESHPTRFPRIENGQMLEILRATADRGVPVGLHNEDQSIVAAGIAAARRAGREDIAIHSPSRPPAAETVATAAFYELGAAAGGWAHIVHTSLRRGLDIAARYRADGHRATIEMCVHYLLLDPAGPDGALGNLIKVNPPIRDGEAEALWAGLAEGLVSFVSSDHASWPLERKSVPSVFAASPGIPGLQTLAPALYTGLRRRHGDAMAMLAGYLAERPAKFFGLWPRKGALAPGFDADLAIVREGAFPYSAATAQDGLRWSPFDGRTFDLEIVRTYLRGRPVWDGDAVLNPQGAGRFLARQSHLDFQGEFH